MSHYENEIRKIKAKGSVDLIRINYLGKIITLKLVDDSDETVNCLTEWRKQYHSMFMSNFTISKERTKKWINEFILKNDTSIFFMIYYDGKIVGNIGTNLYDKKTNTAELDNMMKDPNCHIPGIMTTVEKVYLMWMFNVLKLSMIKGRLFSDNVRMMNVHLKCGWVNVGVSPLKKEITKEGWNWIPNESELQDKVAERYLNLIELSKIDLMKKFENVKYEILS